MNYNFLKFFSFTLVLIMFFAGCTGNKNNIKNDITELTVENVQDGLLLKFTNIRPDATRLFIHFTEFPKGDNVPFSMFSDIRGEQLEKIKQTGTVICPFVQNGHKYMIGVNIHNNDEYDQNNPDENWLRTEIIANNGNYVINNMALQLNETKTGVMLSTEPLFLKEIQYNFEKYRYIITVNKDENWSISFSELVENELKWNFIPRFVEDFNKTDTELNGKNAYVTAYCNIKYNNLLWEVGIARSNEFLISF